MWYAMILHTISQKHIPLHLVMILHSYGSHGPFSESPVGHRCKTNHAGRSFSERDSPWLSHICWFTSTMFNNIDIT